MPSTSTTTKIARLLHLRSWREQRLAVAVAAQRGTLEHAQERVADIRACLAADAAALERAAAPPGHSLAAILDDAAGRRALQQQHMNREVELGWAQAMEAGAAEVLAQRRAACQQATRKRIKLEKLAEILARQSAATGAHTA